MSLAKEKCLHLHEVAAYAVAQATSRGVSDVETVATNSASLSAECRDTRLESLESAESQNLSLRVLFGKRQAAATSSDFSKEAVDELVQRVCDMALACPEDPWAGVAAAEDLATEVVEIESYDPSWPEAGKLEALALEVEASGIEKKGISASLGAGVGATHSFEVLHCSNGFIGETADSHFSLGGGFVAADKSGGMERDHFGDSKVFFDDLLAAGEVGQRAALRTVERLGSRKLESGTMPVLFDERISRSFAAILAGAISGSAVARGVTFLKDSLGEQLFDISVNVWDDPLRRRGMGSQSFDGEGVAVQKRKIIDAGCLTSWLLNSETATRLDMRSTGHASAGIGGPPGVSPSNFWFEQGNASPGELMKDMGNGLLVTDMFGPSFNQNTGDWSVGVAGFAIEKGERAYPVSEITVAGNMKDIFARLVLANDLEMRGSIGAPSIAVDALVVAGV